MAATDDLIQHDVLIIGGGGAGLRAAIAACEADPKLSVGLISKVYPMRSHTVAAEGGAAGVIKEADDLDAHAYDTISGSDWLADQDAVEVLVKEAPVELLQLEHWGCPWNREPDGRVAVRPFGGMKNERTWFAADKTGFHLLHTLFQTSMRYERVTRYDEWFVTKLLIEDGRCCGVTAIEIRTGQMRGFAAGAVVLATGGGGRIFPFTTNGAIKTGDGMALAYRAGVALKDMEFAQYHPTGLPGTGILITEAARGEGGILLNRHGYRYLQDYALGKPLDIHDPRHPQKRTMELGPRDRLSQAFVREQEKGNTFQGKYGDYVHLDVRHLGQRKINKRLPFVRELSKNYVGIDPVHEPIPVRPVLHYMMGGIDTDVNAATSVPGLFAAGECACVSINGANRLGSNSLTEILVFGARAGRAAAAFARSGGAGVQRAGAGLQPAGPGATGAPPGSGAANVQSSILAQLREERERIRRGFLDKSGGAAAGERVATLRSAMREALESGAGIYRTEAKLKQTCETLAELRRRFADVRLDDRSASFNTDLLAALELDFMLDVAQALAHSALHRTESRGSHQRRDYPERDDARFLKHSMAHRTPDGPPRITYKDVTITRWPPGKRVYGDS